MTDRWNTRRLFSFRRTYINIPLIIVGILFVSQFAFSQDMKTLIQRVETTGETLSNTVTLYSTLNDKMQQFFKSNGWTDEITKIKILKVVPLDEQINWYYYVSIGSKNTTSPFYVEYDIYNTHLGTYFFVVPSAFPKEFSNYIDKKNAEIQKNQLELEQRNQLANEIFESVVEEVAPYLDSLKLTLEILNNSTYNFFLEVYEDSSYWSLIDKNALASFLKDAYNTSKRYTPKISDERVIISVRIEEKPNYGRNEYYNDLMRELREEFMKYEGEINLRYEKSISPVIVNGLSSYTYLLYEDITGKLTKLANVLNNDSSFLTSKLESVDGEQIDFYKKYLVTESNDFFDYNTFGKRFEKDVPDIGYGTESDYRKVNNYYIKYLKNLTFFIEDLQ